VTREVPLCGRDRELRLVLDHAARTRSGVVGIAGPAGIGKSRLADAVVERLQANGFRALTGSGGPLHQDLSYAPIVAALRPLVAESRMVRGLGELRRLFDGLSVPRPEPLSERRLARTRLFEAVCTLLRRVATPLVVRLDDLHWADPDTLALLHYLVRGLADRPVLFLLAYRPGECTPDATALLTALRHADQLTETTLGPLDSAAVREFVAELLDDAPPAALLELLPDRAAGVPLFVRALVDGLREEDALVRSGGRWVLRGGDVGQVPDIVADLVLARIEALDEPARTVLDAIAVAGGQLRHDLLAEFVPDETTLLDGVRRLRRAGLVEEELLGGAVGYRAAYRLLTEVAYRLIPAATRAERHAAAVRAVASTTPDALRTLAFHVRNAGTAVPAGEALDVLTEAARAAFADRRGEEAVANARAAIHAADRDGIGVDPELHVLLAESCELAARTDDARAAWLALADLPAATVATRAGALVNAGMAEWDLGRPDAAQACLDRAAACLAGEPPGPAHLALTTTRLRWASRRGTTTEQRALLDELDGLISATGSTRARVTRAGYQVALDLNEGRYDAALAGMAAAVEAADRLGDPVLTEWVHRPTIALLLGCGDLAAARRHAQAGLARAEEAGVPTLGVVHRVCLGLADVFGGQWDDALVASFDALELASRIGSSRDTAFALALQGLLLTRRGRFAEALNRAQEAKERFGPWSAADRHVFGFIDQIEVEVVLGRGDPAEAARLAAALADGSPVSVPLALGALGDAAVRAGDPTTARSAADRLDLLGGPYPRALALCLRGRLARDPALLADGASALGAAGLVYDEAVAVLDRAELGTADPAELAARVRLFDRLSARPQADRARRLLRALGERPAPSIEPGRVPELSGREEQVARLVAEGLSNAEVAARLYISPRTVTTHLQNIYGRLGLGSRTALARYVLEHLPTNT
jgi:DNA-binding CsgD family transcriptional regulator